MVLGLAVLYRYGPSRDKAQWRWVTPGSLVAAVLWLVVSAVLLVRGELRQLQRDLWLARRRDRLHDLDLDLGIVVLVGAELNAEMEHQTARDTTVGPDRPMGQRGATMADTIGAAKA